MPPSVAVQSPTCWDIPANLGYPLLLPLQPRIARGVLKKVKGPIHTSEIVLGEACWNLEGNTKPVHALPSLVGKGYIRL